MQGIPNLSLLRSSEQGVCTQILDATFPGFPNSLVLPLFKTTQLKLAFIFQVTSHYHLELMYISIISLLEFRKVLNVKHFKNTQLMNIYFRKEIPV